MKKIIKILIMLFIIILTAVLYNISSQIKKENAIKSIDEDVNIVQINIIDKNDIMQKLHKSHKKEKYEIVDIIIDGNYYYNVGIRTKGSAIYTHLKYYNSTRFSYKIKLDYMHEDQKYKGMTEIHLNTNVLDETAFREYVAYKIFNEMGIETQNYGLGDLYIGDKHIGLITTVEVINEEYAFYKYNSEERKFI